MCVCRGKQKNSNFSNDKDTVKEKNKFNSNSIAQQIIGQSEVVMFWV